MKLIKLVILVVIIAGASVAQAGIISGEHILSNGKKVALQNLEWLTFDLTLGQSRSQIESNGFLDNYDGGGWRYATRSETERLVNSLWGGTYQGWSTNSGAGATWMRDAFKFSGSGKNGHTSPRWVNSNYNYFFFGNALECSTDPNRSCLGSVQGADNYKESDLTATNVKTGAEEVSYIKNTGKLGTFNDLYGASFGMTTENFTFESSIIRPDTSSLLVRGNSEVPEPSTIAIFVLAIMGLGVRRLV